MQDKTICNRCGKELDFFDQQQKFIIHTRIGYGSIYDGDIVHYQLCNDCFDKTAEECKVFPIIEEG